MNIFLIIYLVIGLIIGCFSIYCMNHDDEVTKDVNELNDLINNCGNIVLFLFGVLYALFLAITWPIAIICVVIKLKKKKKGNK